MLSFRNLSIFIQFEYILYSLIYSASMKGKMISNWRDDMYSNALEIELKNVYKHLLFRRRKGDWEDYKVLHVAVLTVSSDQMYDAPVQVHIA